MKHDLKSKFQHPFVEQSNSPVMNFWPKLLALLHCSAHHRRRRHARWTTNQYWPLCTKTSCYAETVVLVFRKGKKCTQIFRFCCFQSLSTLDHVGPNLETNDHEWKLFGMNWLWFLTQRDAKRCHRWKAAALQLAESGMVTQTFWVSVLGMSQNIWYSTTHLFSILSWLCWLQISDFRDAKHPSYLCKIIKVPPLLFPIQPRTQHWNNEICLCKGVDILERTAMVVQQQGPKNGECFLLTCWVKLNIVLYCSIDINRPKKDIDR